jgi:protocatechuate 3,4-dioxygenase beta subunit
MRDERTTSEEQTMPVETTTKSRRELLAWFGGLGAAAVLAGCGSGSGGGASGSGGASTSTTGASATAATTCAPIPTETAGPYPGDGTNGPNILTQDGVVRRDITSSIGSASGVAEGIPLTIELTVVDTDRCGPRPGTAVYLWHCDRDGQYSMYTLPDENYLRGVQEADASGKLSFTSIFPAAYDGRWPHIHFELFDTLADATHGSNRIAVSQLALPEDACRAVYATDGYEQSVRNLAMTSLDSDMVFSDGHELQDPTMSGSVSSGYTARLTVGV